MEQVKHDLIVNIMEFNEYLSKVKEVKNAYAPFRKKPWGASEYTQGLVGDVGDLMKLIMAKGGFRTADNVDQKLVHELCDCLWAVLAIADELGVNLEVEFMNQMDELKKRIDREGK